MNQTDLKKAIDILNIDMKFISTQYYRDYIPKQRRVTKREPKTQR